MVMGQTPTLSLEGTEIRGPNAGRQRARFGQTDTRCEMIVHYVYQPGHGLVVYRGDGSTLDTLSVSLRRQLVVKIVR